MRTDGDFEGWVVFYLKAIKDSCIEACYRTEVIEAQEVIIKATIDNELRFNKMRDTAHVVLKSLFQIPVFSINQISNATEKSYNTISSILTHFIDLGWVIALDKKNVIKYIFLISIYNYLKKILFLMKKPSKFKDRIGKIVCLLRKGIIFNASVKRHGSLICHKHFSN